MAIKYDERFLVYTSDTRGFEATGLKPLFDRLLRSDRPIILFVHGRGKEPAKSLAGAGFFAGLGGVEGKAVAKLEAYGATVVMFSWDSQRSGFLFFGLTDRERALGNTSEGASRFGRVLGVFDQAIAEARQAGITPPSVTLLAHSMGRSCFNVSSKSTMGGVRLLPELCSQTSSSRVRTRIIWGTLRGSRKLRPSSVYSSP